MNVVRISAFMLLVFSPVAKSQPTQNTPAAPAKNSDTQTTNPAAAQTKQTAAVTPADLENTVEKAVAQYNQNQAKDPDFQLSLGLGSLIVASNASDYTNQSNVLNSTNLGRANPQYLIGASFRAPFSNLNFKKKASTEAVPKTEAVLKDDCREGSTAKAVADEHPCWYQRPWKAFINLKLTSGGSQTLNGYVFGGSYQLLHYLDILVGYGFTPFNEASPGFRVVASQYVTSQQKLGKDLNFDPTAMLKGNKYAFDGFPLTDSNGALIYRGNPLEVHYRGGLVIGLALPLSLKAAFQ